MSTTKNLLILGATTRAAAFSVLRAGLAPRCADYFADRDLATSCPVVRVDPQEGAQGLERAAENVPAGAWIFTGPVENHPELVARLSRKLALLGTSQDGLRGVRDPVRVTEVLRRRGLDCPEVRLSPDGLPRDGSWMIKPIASGGGRRIGILRESPIDCPEPCYFQRRVRGPSFSGLFVADGQKAELIGVTLQLIGAPGSPFAYRGSIGPSPLSGPALCRLRQIGGALTSAFELVGWFGVDFVLRDDRPSPVEVNPRYVASIEILELATGRSIMMNHLLACGISGLAPALPARRNPSAHRSIVGKSIVYASRSLVAPEIPVSCFRFGDPFAIPEVADVPRPGTRIEAGEPILTVFASARDVTSCQARLRPLEELWRRRLES
jgi:predicted ATP-grasp superfamily ATP-dependent carboligase